MDPKIQELQAKLRAAGVYSGPVDGKMGPLTQEALAKFQAMEQQRSAQERDAQARMQELEARKMEAEASKAQAETQRVQAENDPVSRVTKMATEVAPYATGMGAGAAMGHYGFGKPFAKADEATKASAGKLARALDIDPTIKEKQIDTMAGRRGIRNAAQFGAPAVLGGAGYATREYIAPMFSDPGMQDIVKSVGTGENAAAMSLGVHQLVDTLRRGNPVDPVDEAKIRSDAMRARNPQAGKLAQALTAGSETPLPSPAAAAPAAAEAPVAAQASGPKPGTHKYMVAQARELGIKGASAMRKGPLADALAKAMTEHGAKRTVGRRVADAASKVGKASIIAPVAAGAMAYDAMRSPSVADDGSVAEPSSMGEAAAVGAGAAGATAAVPYAASKLPGVLMRTLGRVAGPAAAGLTAYDIANMAVDENAKPNQMLEGATTGTMPQAPGNEKFFALQQALARQAYGR